MQNILCNIPNVERVARIIFGGLLLIGLGLGITKFFAFVLGITLIVEGIMGWCGIPMLVEKYKLDRFLENTGQPNKITPETKESPETKDSNEGKS